MQTSEIKIKNPTDYRISLISPRLGGTRVTYFIDDREHEFFSREDMTERVAEILISQMSEAEHEENCVEGTGFSISPYSEHWS